MGNSSGHAFFLAYFFLLIPCIYSKFAMSVSAVIIVQTRGNVFVVFMKMYSCVSANFYGELTTSMNKRLSQR